MRYPLRVSTVGQRYGVVHAALVSNRQFGFVLTACGRDLAMCKPINAAVSCRACLARLKREGQ